MVKWDIDAVAELSHYLSKRTVIGEYNFVSLDKDENDPDAKELNFICVGEGVRPLEKSLPEYIKKQMITKEGRYYSEIHKHILKQYEKECMNAKRIYKGFVSVNENNRGFFTQHPQTKCLSCSVSCEHEGRVYTSMDELDGCSCTIGTSGEHTELAQLILWRDNPDSFQGESHFRVGLIGASGPATYGLAMLFVDEEQRKKCFKGKKGGERDQYLLCELQTEIRKKFMEVFIGRLHEELEGMEFYTNQGEQLEDEQKNTYFELVEYAASLYLSSVMYRYFLPFLSENDIRRIYNGMHIFVVTMKASRMSPFSLNYAPDGDARFNSSISDEGIESVVKMIPELLRSVLQKFQGVEAFYQVGVKHSYGTGKGETTDKDTRSVQNIKMLAIQGKPAVSCIFGSGKTGEKEKS